ncbi:hypothetical protein EK21DRAFT_90675 [Setomelanomma holmii]|uniref:BTB domain-containing protein n=1 Tax=Setomelanomma holmii TaxID=210430 RepID=A0A9P4H659_9PLEO|nr:hypothetical protein EK21DRAFT_90675 [Setomelanomma holmii]
MASATSGSNKRKWRSTLGLLCEQSTYFQKAFQDGFRESDEKEIHLPDVTASTLRMFQSWLYSQLARAEPLCREKRLKRAMAACQDDDDLQEYLEERAQLEENTVSSGLPYWICEDDFCFEKKQCYVQHFARLYTFADVYNTPQLRKDAMTILVALTDNNSNTPICQFLAKRLAYKSAFGVSTRPLFEAMPSGFLADLLIAVGLYH